MRGVFAGADPSLARILVVESGERAVAEAALPSFYALPDLQTLDVLTCYSGAPANFEAHRGVVHSIHNREATTNRNAFIKRLAHAPYDAVAVICSGSAVLAKWKWLLGALTRSPVVIVDERGEWFFFNVRNPGPLAAMFVRRSNLASIPQALLALLKLAMIPFTVLFLVCYTIAVHARRLFRSYTHRTS